MISALKSVYLYSWSWSRSSPHSHQTGDEATSDGTCWQSGLGQSSQSACREGNNKKVTIVSKPPSLHLIPQSYVLHHVKCIEPKIQCTVYFMCCIIVIIGHHKVWFNKASLHLVQCSFYIHSAVLCISWQHYLKCRSSQHCNIWLHEQYHSIIYNQWSVLCGTYTCIIVLESPTSPPSPIVSESYPISRSNSSKLIWITCNKIWFDKC